MYSRSSRIPVGKRALVSCVARIIKLVLPFAAAVGIFISINLGYFLKQEEEFLMERAGLSERLKARVLIFNYCLL